MGGGRLREVLLHRGSDAMNVTLDLEYMGPEKFLNG